MSLSSKELHKICYMRLHGKPWREIKEAIPHKNVYEKFKRLSRIIISVNNQGFECRNCYHVHDIKVTPCIMTDEWAKKYLEEDDYLKPWKRDN